MRKKIASYFKDKTGIAAVYLFGSHAKKKTTKTSDVDIAVFFEPNAIPDFRKQLEMKEDLTSLLKKEVDLLVMNTANPIVRHQVFKYGKILFLNNPSKVNAFFVQSLMEYDDIQRVRRVIEKNILKGRVYGR